MPVREVVRRATCERHERLDRFGGLLRVDNRTRLVVEQTASVRRDDLEEGAEESGLPSGETEDDAGRREPVPRLGYIVDAVAPHPEHPDVDAARDGQQGSTEGAKVD